MLLSNYLEDTLIPDDPANDIEKQWINDGVGQLWPHDWQMVAKSFLIDHNENPTVYYLPLECEHVSSVYASQNDVNSRINQLQKIPHYDGWLYDNAFVEATIKTDDTGEPWIDQTKKAVVLQDVRLLGQRTGWLFVRYARRWPYFNLDTDCINPSPNRVLAILYFAASQYFNSQFQVSAESIRYQNYMAMSQRFQQLAQIQLVKDSKPLAYS
jgi:hypothetical protein